MLYMRHASFYMVLLLAVLSILVFLWKVGHLGQVDQMGGSSDPFSLRNLAERMGVLESLVARNEKDVMEMISMMEEQVSDLRRLAGSVAKAPPPAPAVPEDDDGSQVRVGNSGNNNILVGLEFARRRNVVQTVCNKFRRLDSKKPSHYHFWANSTRLSQHLEPPTSILLEPRTRTAYCFIHKVASSTWMTLYTRIHRDEHAFKRLIKSGKIYKVKDLLGARSAQEIVEKVLTGVYFSFVIVRHPFDRLLSAFRDRIQKLDTGQAKTHIPRIFDHVQNSGGHVPDEIMNDMFDHKTGQPKFSPTFRQFVEYVLAPMDGSINEDVHWIPYHKTCSPCLVSYDAIVKLESQGSRETDYIISHSGLVDYIGSVNVTVKNPTKGGSSTDHREEFYSTIPCSLLNGIMDYYLMDMLMFEYTMDRFKQFCTANQ